jgi:hypothetical protein
MAWQPFRGENMPLREVNGLRYGMANEPVSLAEMQELAGTMPIGAGYFCHVDLAVSRPVLREPCPGAAVAHEAADTACNRGRLID